MNRQKIYKYCKGVSIEKKYLLSCGFCKRFLYKDDSNILNMLIVKKLINPILLVDDGIFICKKYVSGN